MLKQQALQAFEVVDVGPCHQQQLYTDRLTVEKLPADMPYRSVRELAEQIVEATQEEVRIRKDRISVHGMRCDNTGWRIEIRSEDPIPHYKMQPVVQAVITEKLTALEAEQTAAMEEAQPAIPPALQM